MSCSKKGDRNHLQILAEPQCLNVELPIYKVEFDRRFSQGSACPAGSPFQLKCQSQHERSSRWSNSISIFYSHQIHIKIWTNTVGNLDKYIFNCRAKQPLVKLKPFSILYSQLMNRYTNVEQILFTRWVLWKVWYILNT